MPPVCLRTLSRPSPTQGERPQQPGGAEAADTARDAGLFGLFQLERYEAAGRQWPVMADSSRRNGPPNHCLQARVVSKDAADAGATATSLPTMFGFSQFEDPVSDSIDGRLAKR